ncbi:hypothetical protein [Helicobacter trogontum]|nr:hypothetical protein [Helicobacter trogontum]
MCVKSLLYKVRLIEYRSVSHINKTWQISSLKILKKILKLGI